MALKIKLKIENEKYRVVSPHKILTADAWVNEPDLAPQKMKLSQKFRHLMRCKKYLSKICLPCLVSEMRLFVYIFLL